MTEQEFMEKYDLKRNDEGKIVVGGDLYLQETPITQLPERLTVGGYLDLRETKITQLPSGLTVGGGLWLQGTKITKQMLKDCVIKPKDNFIDWGTHCKVDGVFTQVLSRKGKILKVKYINKEKEAYLVTDGQGKWAHGDTIKDAKESLIYKISNRDTTKYKGLTVDSKLSFSGAVECYRVVTGACAEGARYFVEQNDVKKKDYMIKEIIDMTKGQYGHESLVGFFCNMRKTG